MDAGSNRMYKTCVNSQQSKTYFAYHKLLYRFKGKVDNSYCESLKEQPLKTTEYRRIVDIFDHERNRKKFSELGLDEKLFLSPLQLAPCADFTDPADQQGTFFVENIAPSFNRILLENWSYMEMFLRKSISEDTEIVTGQLGHLRFPSKSGERVGLILDDPLVGQTKDIKQPYNNVEVPEFFYKIARNSRLSLVIITSNNPLLKTLPDEQKMCKSDLCPVPSRLKDFSKGYTYCCPLPEFVKSMKQVHKTDFNGVLFNDSTVETGLLIIFFVIIFANFLLLF